MIHKKTSQFKKKGKSQFQRKNKPFIAKSKPAGKIYKRGGMTTLVYDPPRKQLSPFPDRMFTTVYTTGQYYGMVAGLTVFSFDVQVNSLQTPFYSGTTGSTAIDRTGGFVTAVTGSATSALQPIGIVELGGAYSSYTVLTHKLMVKLNLAGAYSTSSGTVGLNNAQSFMVCVAPYVIPADASTTFHQATQHPRSVTRVFRTIDQNKWLSNKQSEPEIQGWDMKAFLNDVSGTHDTSIGAKPASPTIYRVWIQSVNGSPIGSNDSVEVVLQQRVMLNEPIKNII